MSIITNIDEFDIATNLIHLTFITAVLEIGNAQKNLYTRQKSLADKDVEINQLKLSNKETKSILMDALIQRDEHLIKKSALNTTNERLFEQNESLHREIDDLLRGDEVDSICERFSYAEQNSILKDIQDARCKLIKYGFPLSFFA